jgi:hypothetical protein
VAWPSLLRVFTKGMVELVVVEFIDLTSFSLSYPLGWIVELFRIFLVLLAGRLVLIILVSLA